MSVRTTAITISVVYIIFLPKMLRAAAPIVQTTARQVAESEQGRGEEDRESDQTDDTYRPVIAPAPAAASPTAIPQEQMNTRSDTLAPSAATDTVIPNAVLIETPVAPAPIVSTTFPWAWIVTRVTGITSYVLLALLSITGMLQTTGMVFRIMSPASAWSFHRAIASTLLVSVLTHVGSLLFDSFMNLRLVDVLVPLISPYRPLLVALGITGFYLMLLLIATSLYSMVNHPRLWRTIHFFSFVMFTAVFLHGILIGTDSKLPWVRTMYWTTAAIVAAAVVYRVWWKYHTPAERRITEETAR